MDDLVSPRLIALPRWSRLGVLSDSHVPHRLPALPKRVMDLFADCDAILHAGDLETPDILAELSRVAPAYAVRGNLHWQFSTGTHDQDLPLSLLFQAGPHTIWLTHGHLRFRYSVVDKLSNAYVRETPLQLNERLIARLAQWRPAQANIVIFGHSHFSCAVWREGVLYFNPGAVAGLRNKAHCQSPRVGVLHLGADRQVAWEWREL